MSVNQAGAGYLGAASHALVYRPQSIRMLPSTLTVLYGHRVTFAGRVVNGRPGELVTITARRWGHQPFLFATVKAGRDGRFSFAARPGILTAYVAHLRTRPGEPEGAGRRSADDHGPRARQRTDPDPRRRERSRSAAGWCSSSACSATGWQTIAKRAPACRQCDVVRDRLPNSVIRVAMSVNQAGAGLHGLYEPRRRLPRGLTELEGWAPRSGAHPSEPRRSSRRDDVRRCAAQKYVAMRVSVRLASGLCLLAALFTIGIASGWAAGPRHRLDHDDHGREHDVHGKHHDDHGDRDNGAGGTSTATTPVSATITVTTTVNPTGLPWSELPPRRRRTSRRPTGDGSPSASSRRSS